LEPEIPIVKPGVKVDFVGQEIKTKKVLDYESTLEIADLLLKKDLKLIKKTTRYYQLKVFNSNTRRAR